MLYQCATSTTAAQRCSLVLESVVFFQVLLSSVQKVLTNYFALVVKVAAGLQKGHQLMFAAENAKSSLRPFQSQKFFIRRLTESASDDNRVVFLFLGRDSHRISRYLIRKASKLATTCYDISLNEFRTSLISLQDQNLGIFHNSLRALRN